MKKIIIGFIVIMVWPFVYVHAQRPPGYDPYVWEQNQELERQRQ